MHLTAGGKLGEAVGLPHARRSLCGALGYTEGKVSARVCRLCLENKPLLKSHVLPEFLYKPLYSETGGALTFHTAHPHVRELRKGLREPMLCEKCEIALKEYEDCFADVWMDLPPLRTPLPDGKSHIGFEGLDYRRFKLFHLSIAWRTGVAQSADFSPVFLNNHAEALRQCLLTGETGSRCFYPVFAALLKMRTKPRVAIGSIALAPPESVGSFTATSTIYAGCNWYCVLGEDAQTPFGRFYLTEAGRILMPIESIADRRALTDLVISRRESLDKIVQKISKRNGRGAVQPNNALQRTHSHVTSRAGKAHGPRRAARR